MYQLTNKGKDSLFRKQISCSTLQQDLEIGFLRATAIIEALKEAKALRKTKKQKK